VQAFVSEDVVHKDPEDVAIFQRVALTPFLIARYELAPYPPKAKDRRGGWGNEETCQLEALPPEVLADLLDRSIRYWLDEDTLEKDREVEVTARRNITRALPSAG
jgi:hypothetical protein